MEKKRFMNNNKTRGQPSRLPHRIFWINLKISDVSRDGQRGYSLEERHISPRI